MKKSTKNLIKYIDEELKDEHRMHSGEVDFLYRVKREFDRLQQRVVELEQERDALAAHVERLKESAKPFINAFASHRGSVAKDGNAKLQDFLDLNQVVPKSTIGDWRKLFEAFNQSPKTSLAEVRAQQSEESYLIGWNASSSDFNKCVGKKQDLAKEHANIIRNGGE